MQPFSDWSKSFAFASSVASSISCRGAQQTMHDQGSGFASFTSAYDPIRTELRFAPRSSPSFPLETQIRCKNIAPRALPEV